MEKLKQIFKKIGGLLEVKPVTNVKLPEFPPDRVCRYRITFSGRVQDVGFRLEVQGLANGLELTGFCENLPGGEVLAELQGQENKILFLIAHMESLPRIRIDNKVMEELPLCPEERGFQRG